MTKNLARPRRPDDEPVLEAAAQVFRRRGYGAATVREVARAAGLLPGSLHYRFPSKETLLLRLMARAIEAVSRRVREAAASDREPVARIRAGLRAHLECLLSGDDSFYVLLYDWRSLEGPARAEMLRLRGRYEALWDELLADAVAAGAARPGVDPVLVRQFGFGAVNWVAQWYALEEGRTAQEIADAFWDYLAFGVLSAPHRRKLSTPARRRRAPPRGKRP